ncbi:GNAT family N-acetyltransferase [Streptomyces sp. NBC_01092]|uniref:GNAT family N-acetyltransferase n=1 Tax=Streptomyces sp. NBC_01092 TaxID=2903748 RepID=UPI00386BB1E4|nr:GNAT family N-acetyltransferase [Streptomyces sp. NBC_01092]
MGDLAILRHLRESDIPGRIAALGDSQVRRNITNQPALVSEASLTQFFLDIVHGKNPTRIEFVVAKPDGTVLGYTYLMGFDYLNLTCEIAMLVLPRYRFGMGYAAMLLTYEHAFGVLNMRSVLNQVYASNEMMCSVKWRAASGAALSADSDFTEGKLRATYSWNQTREDFLRKYREPAGAADVVPTTNKSAEKSG